MRLSFSTLSSILFIIFLPFFLFFSFLRTGRTEDSKDFIATLVVYIRTHRCWREFLRCRGGHRSKYFFFLFFFINCHVNIPFDIFIPRSFFFPSPLYPRSLGSVCNSRSAVRDAVSSWRRKWRNRG